MKNLLCLFLISLTISGCAYLAPNKRDIEQGNLFTNSEIRALRTGMSQGEVKRIMGEPIMTNIFTTGQIVYVYTTQPGGQPLEEKQVICTFNNGRLTSITTQ